MILNYITWNVSPWLYEGDYFAIGWYGVITTLAIVVVYLLQKYLYTKREKLPRQYADVAFIACTILGILFCHWFDMWFYQWIPVSECSNPELAASPIIGNYCNVSAIQIKDYLRIGHGMASHGVDFGMFLGCLIVAKLFFQCNVWWIMDRMVVSRLAFHAISRWSNMFNSEIYGNPTDLPWGVLFVQNGDTLACHPTAVYESILALVAIGIWWWLYDKKKMGLYKGMLTGISLLMLWIPRVFIECIKPVQHAFEDNLGLNMGQWLSIPYIVCGIVLIIWSWKKGCQINMAPTSKQTKVDAKRHK